MKIKKLITVVFFQIGVNVIGIPEIISHNLNSAIISKSKFF
jgi:hypothetical protein